MQEETVFSPAEILLPKQGVSPNWCVIACDQYTSQPDYWQRVADQVGEDPSTLQLIYPEVWLEQPDKPQRIRRIHRRMRELVLEGFFQSFAESYFYLERQLPSGKVRRGLIGKIDLEAYDYRPDSRCLVRPTEGTVESRLPPRMEIRQGALLELPHVMLLVDDPACRLLEPLGEAVQGMRPVYEVSLMENGGRVRGWQVDLSGRKAIEKALGQLYEEGKGLLFAVGDGNHSLATAKACFEKLKSQLPKEQWERHPARYALVEVCNIHDPSLEFEPIHRVAFQVDPKGLLKRLEEALQKPEGQEGIPITWVTETGEGTICLPAADLPQAIAWLQAFLDRELEDCGGQVDYIHGEAVVRQLVKTSDRMGFLLPPLGKEQLFSSVRQNGPLPRKTFSMGEAWEKRYYLEARRIL